MTEKNSNTAKPRYALLEDILAIKGVAIKPAYSTKDLAELFDVTARAIQNWVSSGKLSPRSLPGRAKYLTQDIEDFLIASRTSRA